MTGAASSYPRELEGTIRLRRGLELVVRPLQPSEGEWIRELHRGLSERTQYLRFFAVMPTLPDPLVALLTAVDYRRRLALIVEARTASTVEPVALAGYAAADDDGSVEVGIVVRDDWQARGIGSALARRLLEAARTRGFERFAAYVLLENAVGRRFIERIGQVVSMRTRGPVAEVLFMAIERNGRVPLDR
jgi:GNAT superfamily N-acetyltransferase